MSMGSALVESMSGVAHAAALGQLCRDRNQAHDNARSWMAEARRARAAEAEMLAIAASLEAENRILRQNLAVLRARR